MSLYFECNLVLLSLETQTDMLISVKLFERIITEHPLHFFHSIQPIVQTQENSFAVSGK